MSKGTAPDFARNVFINCPFDTEYRPLFQAIVFTVFECGLRPRCALEVHDSGIVRIDTIAAIIRDCKWGIHDISRTELNPNGLPRFNMPLELGMFLGAKRFGAGSQKDKSCLILDRDKYRYQEFISDIAGQDIEPHHTEPEAAIRAVRHWLTTSQAAFPNPPGPARIAERFAQFEGDLPGLCARLQLQPGEMTFVEYADAARGWLRRQLDARR